LVTSFNHYRDKKVVGVFVRFRAPLRNGTDAYNAYRRTGFPKRMQPNIDEKADGFIRSFLYPADVGTNPNITQKQK
jgi:hypothetical protein